MKRTLLATACLLALGALLGCSTVEVSTDYDRAADFTVYRTFGFAPSPEIKNPLMYDRIVDAVAAELTAKGMQRVDRRPDLLVALHGRHSTQTQIDTTTYGYGWGAWGYWNRWGYGRVGAASSTVREVPVGTIIVDLVDATQKKMVWQGIASDTLDPRATADQKDERVRDAMQRMFADFPPKPR